MDYNPYSSVFISRILQENNLWLSRNKGQNYLIDRNIAQMIIDAVPPDIPVLEVGSGLGSLTLLLSTRRTYSIEIDRGIYKLLSSILSSPGLTLILDDFLKYDLSRINEKELYFVSNLPYSISGEAIRRFIEENIFREGIVMVQREFLDRMTAKPGGGDYGVLAVLSQTFLSAEELFPVSRNCFFPAPTVDSVVVRLRKKEKAVDQNELKVFLQKAFQSRRKTIRNNLKSFPIESAKLEELGIDPRSRPEEIPVEKWMELFLFLRMVNRR
jgi:16S rRNA (adenine1518-N6/adenine1519-N6)-dimethyltransferase